MRFPPAIVLFTWPTPNYVDPVTRGDGALVVSIVFIVLAFLVTCLRLYTRLRITCSPGIDDILIVIALGLAIAMCVVICIATEQYGWTRHLWDVPLPWLSTAKKLNLLFQILFSLCSSITKLSLLWFCKRLIGAGSKGVYRSYSIVLIAAMVFVTICCLLFLFISIFQCNPIRAYWELETPYPHTCIDDGAAVFSASVVNIFTDLLSTVLPMPIIWNLKLPARQRIAVISIFGLGIVVNIAGSIRTAYVYKSMISSYDETWMGWPVLLAATVEINLGLICASAPALRPLISSFLPQLLQSTRQYASSSKRRSAFIFWSSPGPSKNTNTNTNTEEASEAQLHHKDVEAGLDRFEVMRTVEMETWSESRTPTHAVGSFHDIQSNHTRVETPVNAVDLKDGAVTYTSPGSSKSGSMTHAITDSPFEDKNSV
ncbi:hypothetical protein ASPWEDRAFT_99978 [Aspergillus wentii DTO 134E9]|uniref:Rhodopsin domain-containing protein n=1 Tax=Aspergillus wentii DTO 134E9 TaxID=1073089 RepID=A0A1L9S2L3_ASPWE|nr:uncharacterized protein ASPWEDRAFT_99978 [Aspergillus wentii DTO 134E9]OJJ41408.1 hypothetical protein ASPWEDRAFT_99978 [Aspergillus wentii DTO 134E9]